MSNKVQDTNLISDFNSLYADACSIIEDARERAYRAVNVSLTFRNWMLGERIAREKFDGVILVAYTNIYAFTNCFQIFWTQCVQNPKKLTQ